MSQYKCRTVPLSKLPIGANGVPSSLCDTCQTRDCTNPIKIIDISIFGNNHKMKLFVKGKIPNMVVDCERISLYAG